MVWSDSIRFIIIYVIRYDLIHSYEVDIWSIGCILFTLLVGKPPFETQTLKETYKRIRANEYHVPSRIGLQAKNLIRQLLQVCFWKFRVLNSKQWIIETRLKIPIQEYSPFYGIHKNSVIKLADPNFLCLGENFSQLFGWVEASINQLRF